MKYLMLIISVFSGSAKSLFTKQIKNNQKNNSELFVDNTVTFAITLLIICTIAFFAKDTPFANLPFGLAFCYGIFTLLSQIFLLLATGSGSVSISSLFYSCGFIIPTFFGAVYYNEKLNFLHIISIVLIVISFLLGASKEEGKKFDFKWLIYALGGLLFSGLVGVLQKIFATEYKSASLNGFLIIAFAIIVITSLSIALILTIKNNSLKKDCCKQSKRSATLRLIFSVFLGICMATVNLLNTRLSGILPSALFFPCVNGGAISITAILSALIFKEKLSAKKIAGVVLCIVAIIGVGLATTI